MLTVGKATKVFFSAHRDLARSGNGLNVPTTTRGLVILGVLVLVFGLYNFFLPDSAWRRTHRSNATGPSASGRRVVRIVGVLALVIGMALLIGAAAGKT